MPNAPPRLRAGALLDHEGLRAATAEAVEKDGRSQTEIARNLLGKSPSAVSNATRKRGRTVETMQIRLIETLTPYKVAGPFYRLERGE